MQTTTTPTIILIAGHWLGAWAWDEVLEELGDASTSVLALTLPGLDPEDPERASRGLEDQADAILDVMAQRGRTPVILVAHSGANAPVSIIMDRHPELVERVVWIDSGPVSSGSVFAPDLPEEVRELPLPPFDVLAQQASIEGLDEEALDRFRARAVPEPAAVLREPIVLTNEARRNIATTLVCSSIPGVQVTDLARAGHPMFAEVAHLTHVDFVDLPTGHWPMWSAPRELARVIREEAARPTQAG